MLKTQFERPAAVLLSAMWSLAAVLAIVAFAVSVLAVPREPVAQASHQMRMVRDRSVESVTTSSMLREPRLAISKDKLD
jgi:hypothetical protein